ncbi:MAG: hypothetical protein M3460_02550 [Actinomycetota bacterium]|nr:hypothetical protein [Actinomycetota bacterium]
MSTPLAHHEPERPRVERTIGGISDALRGGRRAQFFAELLRAQQGQQLDDVLNAWWGRAMLNIDPDRIADVPDLPMCSAHGMPAAACPPATLSAPRSTPALSIKRERP